MAYLVTTVHKSATSRYAMKLHRQTPDGATTILIYADGPCLVSCNVDPNSEPRRNVTARGRFKSPSNIQGLAPFQLRDGSTGVAVLTPTSIIVVRVPSNVQLAHGLLFKIPLAKVPGHQDSLDISPVFLTCSHGDFNYIILYKYTGFVTVIAKKIAARDGHAKVQSHTFSIGFVSVTSMAILEGSVPTLAVLYRDIDFNYSLRYYKFHEPGTFCMVAQMEHFSGAPSHVMAVGPGAVVVSDLQMWFFASPKKATILESSVGDSAFPVSYNKAHNVVTLDMSANKESYLGGRFEASTQIDNHRYLLVSDRGTTLILYVDAVSAVSATRVRQFQIIDLGKSTVASSLVHLGANVFYACSHYSSSVLFRILPQAPHIDILLCAARSAPILSMNLEKNALLLSRGGFHSGELEHFSELSYTAHCQQMARAKADNVAFSVAKHGKSDYVFLRDATGKTTRVLAHPSLVQANIQPSDIVQFEPHSPKQGTARENDVRWSITGEISLDFSGGKYKLKKQQENLCVFEDPSVLGAVEWCVYPRSSGAPDVHVYFALWKGELSHYAYAHGEARLMDRVDTRLVGHKAIAWCRTSATSFVIVVLTGDGEIFQMPGTVDESGHEKWDTDSASYLHAKGSSGTFRMSCSARGYLVYDSYSVYRLCPTSPGYLALLKLHSFSDRVQSCHMVESGVQNGSFLVLFEDGTLGHYVFGPSETTYRFGSQGLILSSVHASDSHTVALQLERKPDVTTGETASYPALVLLQRPSLELLHEYRPKEKSNYVDMCVMGAEHTPDNENYIVVANSVDAPQDFIKVFRVKQDKLEPVAVSISGSMPKKAELARIACHANSVFVVGSVLLRLALVKTDRGYTWRVSRDETSFSPFFGAAVGASSSYAFVADIVHGLVAMPYTQPSETSSHFVFGTPQLKALAVLQNTPVVVTGDSWGNIRASAMVKAQGSSHRMHTLFNAKIDESINDIVVLSEAPLVVLVATLEGNVYRIQDISMYPRAARSLGRDLSNSTTPPEFGSDEQPHVPADHVVDGRTSPMFNFRSHAVRAETIEFAKMQSEARSLTGSTGRRVK